MYKHLCFLPLLGMFFFATSVFSQKKNNDDTRVFFDKKDKVSWIYHEKWCLYALGDAKGNALTIFRFGAPAHFQNNIAIVKSKGKYFFINKTGQLWTNGHQFILPGTQNTYITESDCYTHDGVELYGYAETPNFPLTPQLLKKLQSLHYTQLRILSKKYASFLTISQLSGLIDCDGKIIFQPVYDNIFKTGNGCIGFELHQKFGLANPQMQWIFPVAYQYNEISPGIRGEDTFPAFIKLKTGQLWGGVFRSTLQKIEPRYSSITNFISGKAWAERDNHFFILDSLAIETSVGPKDQCTILSDELMLVNGDGYKMVKNLHNQWISPPGTSFKSIQKGLLLFVEKDGAGYIYDQRGRQVSARRYYDLIDEFGECLLVADSTARCAVLSITGEELFPAEHEYIKGAYSGFSASEILVLFKIPAEYGTEEYRRLKKQNSWFTWPKRYFSTQGICLNRNGQNYKNIYPVSNGLIVFERDTVRGIFDPNGYEIILPSTKITGYSPNGVYLHELSSKYVVISSDDKQMGLMDQHGKVFVEPEFTAFSPVGNEYIAVQKNGKWGLMDAAGSIVIKPTLDTVLYIHYGYFLAKMKGRWGAIDAKGTWAHWPEYDEIKPHEDGCFLFKKDTLYTYNYDDEAEELLEIAPMIPVEEKQYEEFEMGVVPADLPYDLVWSPANGMTLVQKNRKYGYINPDKQEVIAPKYNYAENFIHDIAKVGVAGRYGLINKKGVEILPLIYTDFETSYLKKSVQLLFPKTDYMD